MSIRELQARVDQLSDEIRSLNFETRGAEWRAMIALELNCILARAQYGLETSGDASDIEFAEAALSIARRVAEFEGIREKE